MTVESFQQRPVKTGLNRNFAFSVIRGRDFLHWCSRQYRRGESETSEEVEKGRYMWIQNIPGNSAEDTGIVSLKLEA